MSRADVRRISTAAIRAAEAEMSGKPFAVVVIVRELPEAGMPINVASNINSGRLDVLRVVQEGLDAVRGGA